MAHLRHSTLLHPGCMRGLRLLTVAIGSTLIAGAVDVSVHSGSSPQAPPVPAARRLAPTPEVLSAHDAKHRASQEAQRLLKLVVPPPGARRTSNVPAVLSGPATGVPTATTIVVKTLYWNVPMSLDDAATWFQAHPPGGLSSSVGETGSDNGVLSQGFSYSAVVRAGEQESQLEIGIVSAGDGRASIRADGIVIWLDPRPIVDHFRGARLRFRLTQGCPAALPADAEDVSNDPHEADLKARLVPNEQPTSGLICDYVQPQSVAAPYHVVERHPLDATQALNFALSLFERDPSHADGEISSCPGIGDRHVEVLVFGYPDRQDVDVWSSGSAGFCGGTSNGVIEVPGRIPPS